MLIRPTTLLCLTGALLIGGLSAYVDTNPVRQVRLRQTLAADTLPKLSLPEGADPNDPDWKDVDLESKAPVQPLSPADEAKQFLLPPGYQIEPILTEPAIQQPAAISFDANGRMYVLELRTYMLDADSKGELAPTSRISRWEDKNNDGIYETGTTFVDNLIFPRFVLPYGKDCILSMESDADNVYKYTDTNGDGKADKKEFFTNKYGRSGNVEHQQAFMYWGMDNWLYSTVNAFRVRETPNGVIREKTGFNRAQWGVTHDDNGKLWFQGGASGLPSYFQFPIHYGNFDVPNEFAKGFDVPWGAAVKLADMQGGMDEVRQPDGSLKRVTGSAGNDVYRGDRLPAELKGQYFYGEPVARIVRQINPVVNEGLTTLHNVYQEQQSEFLRSTDPLFRPVDMTTAPDGTLYITDMYHGIIQEGQWTQRGTYLRTKIEQYQLDKVVGLGRIWRITYTGKERDKTRPNMYGSPSAALVKHLAHPNGWWRDAAQQVLVQRKDLSVVPQLTALARTSPNHLARTHALWTLEGLGALPAATVQQLLKDPNPKIRIQALRAGETLYKTGDKTLEPALKQAMADTDTDVQIQAMLTAKVLKLPDLETSIKAAMASNTAAGVKLVGEQILTPARPRNMGPFGAPELSAVQKASVERGALIYNELCSQCHGNTGLGTPAGNGRLLAPALAGSLRLQGHPEYAVRVVLHGLEGPIEGKTYAGGMMASMKEQSDEWMADVLSYIRNGLSNDAPLVSAQQVAAIRAKTIDQKGSYQFASLTKLTPFELQPQTLKATASHTSSTRIGGNVSPASAFTYEGWSTGGRQEKGMWYQIELPQDVRVAELHFTASPVRRPGWKPTPGAPPTPPPMIQTYPRTYTVETSTDGQHWQVAKADQKGTDGDNVLLVNSPKTRYLRLSLAENVPSNPDDVPWSMRQLKVFAQQ
ncbi:membrane-bound dehydrogenase domain protein [Fibrella aestuarina BUZ 2]|uniref:Membrane-bound dehydrogenase domain protein n=1 Tax=Fibrella aestuarina BUZ 2 TaxID=1166018 RepID=I0K2B4_9BACT|nr:membrane-bound dehydrogenase domain protein [Fibrella aestuarina BUZ 2]